MTLTVAETTLNVIAIGAGLIFTYLWLQGLVGVISARRDQIGLQRNRRFWDPITADPYAYSGRGREQVLRARRSWHLAMIFAVVGVFSAGLAELLACKQPVQEENGRAASTRPLCRLLGMK